MYHPQLPGQRLVADLGHPLNRGRVAWWLGLPDTFSPAAWTDLIGPGRKLRRQNVRELQAHGIAMDLTQAYFNGTNARFQSSPAPFVYPTAALTLAAWIFPNAMFGSRSIAGEYASGGALACLLHIGNSKLFGYVTTTTGAGNAISSGTIPASGASFLCMTWDGATIRLYINGVADGTDARGGTLLVPPGFHLGWNTDSAAWFQGYLFDVGLWNRALSPAEIRQYMLLSRNGYAGLLVHEPAPWDLPVEDVTVPQSMTADVAVASHVRKRIADHVDRASLLDEDDFEYPLVLRNRGWMLSSGLRRPRY